MNIISKQLSVDSIMLILSVRMLGMMILSVRMPGTGVKTPGMMILSWLNGLGLATLDVK